MSDLVERLQRFPEFYLCQDAADEIVRLQKLVEEMTEALDIIAVACNMWTSKPPVDENAKVIGELAQSTLSKALSNKEETK